MSYEMDNKKTDPALSVLKGCRDLVWPEIKRYLETPEFPDAFEIPESYRSDENYHWKAVSEYPERQGKYLRPTLLILASEAMGQPIDKTLPVAAAMQISEDWLLVHDDFMDRSLERRGKPTLHTLYGDEIAVNSGDALHLVMWKVLLDSSKVLGPEKMLTLADEFYTMLTRTAIGQAIEAKWTRENKTDFSDDDWFFIADGKTSYYTIAGPMRLGAIIAGATEEQLGRLADFGTKLGRCFQLVDDVLDVTSDFAGLKNQKGNDIYEGKRTILLGHLLRSVDSKDQKKLSLILAKSREDKTEEEVEWVMKKMGEYGSIEYANSLAKQLKQEALDIFKSDLAFLSKEPAREQLETLIHFILERDH